MLSSRAGTYTKFVLKAVFTLLFLSVALRKCDFGTLSEAFRGAKLWLVAVAFLLHVPGYLLTGWRWQILLRGQKARAPLRSLVSLCLVGTFFNNFLPSTVGGDVFRVLGSARYFSSKSRATAVIIVERLTGVFGLSVLALGATVLGAKVPAGKGIVWCFTVLFAFFFAGTLVICNFRLRHFLEAALGRLRPVRVRDALLTIVKSFSEYRGKPGPVLAAIGLSLLLQANVVLYYILIARSLAIGIAPLEMFFIVPAALLVMMVPLTVNAMGIRENAFIFLLGEIGVASEPAIAVSWVAFGLILVYAAFGGIIYAARR